MTAPPAGALEACPFCGNADDIEMQQVQADHYVQCLECEASTSCVGSRREAAELWNRRTHGPALLAALRLREWRPIAESRPSGRYLVASREGEVREARWMSKRYRWVFPSAQSAFDPIAFAPLPAPPPADDLARVLEGSANGMRDAYEGAREDLLDWKGRAQRAERTLRGLGYTGIDASEAPQPAEGDGAVAWRTKHRDVDWSFTTKPHPGDIVRGIWEPLYTRPAAPKGGVVDAIRERLVECRDWFDQQADVISKGGGSTWDMLECREQRDLCKAALATGEQP